MKMTNAVNKMKRVGEVKDAGHGYYVESGRQVLTVLFNGRREDNEVATIHVRRTADKPDSMSDYFPGAYFKSMKAAIDYMAL